jgi:hypothetical protein
MDRSALDRLYAAPLAEFVRTRDALAKAARREGDASGAAGIKALARPPVPAWALNQVARRDRRRFERWLAAVAALHAAQVELLSGAVRTDALRTAQRAEREAMVELREAAVGALEAGGQSVGVAVLERVVRTFRGAAMDAAAREDLRAGRLAAEHDEPGFESLVGVPATRRNPPAAAPARSPRAPSRDAASPRRAVEDRAAAERRDRLVAARERLRVARDERATARAEVRRAAAAAEHARRSADEAAARARTASEAARGAAKALERAEKAVAALEREVTRLEGS